MADSEGAASASLNVQILDIQILRNVAPSHPPLREFLDPPLNVPQIKLHVRHLTAQLVVRKIKLAIFVTTWSCLGKQSKSGEALMLFLKTYSE